MRPVRHERSRPRAARTPLPALALAACVLLPTLAVPAPAATRLAAAGAQTPQEGVGHEGVGQDLEPGSNSFTEGQVRERFGRMGFGEVRDLRKDDQGIWHGRAMHAGKELSIRMDYRGNVAAE